MSDNYLRPGQRLHHCIEITSIPAAWRAGNFRFCSGKAPQSGYSLLMNSRKRHSLQFVLLFTFLTGVGLNAQPAKPSSATKHSLWKVQGKENAVYLLGSIHLLKKEDYPLPAPLEAVFSDSKIAVFETDIAGMENPELVMKLTAKGQLPEGETLR